MNLPADVVELQTPSMRTYGQYCLVARTSELIAERWTPIIIRNLLAGCETFGELLDGAPGISKALLAQRLDLLEAHGVLTKVSNNSRRGHVYELTEKGRELRAVCDAMGSWGARWIELEDHHVEAAYVLWATCKLVDVSKAPNRGLIVRINLNDQPNQPFWLIIRRTHAELCSSYPGQAEDVILRTSSGTLARWNLRHITLEQAVRAGEIVPEGPRSKVKLLFGMIRPSPFAQVQPASQ
jgi:DNA-binding HxlR family transcriptional regulator